MAQRRALKIKDLSDFREIYEQNEAYVRKCLYWLLNKENIDDVVQEVFVRVWRSKDQFQNKSSLKTWIYRIATNCAYDHIRREKKYVAMETENLKLGSVDSSEESYLRRQLIKRAIAQLSEKQRIVFVLYYLQELSVEEVAIASDLSEGTVKSRLHSGREIVANELKKSGFDL